MDELAPSHLADSPCDQTTDQDHVTAWLIPARGMMGAGDTWTTTACSHHILLETTRMWMLEEVVAIEDLQLPARHVSRRTAAARGPRMQRCDKRRCTAPRASLRSTFAGEEGGSQSSCGGRGGEAGAARETRGGGGRIQRGVQWARGLLQSRRSAG